MLAFSSFGMEVALVVGGAAVDEAEEEAVEEAVVDASGDGEGSLFDS